MMLVMSYFPLFSTEEKAFRKEVHLSFECGRHESRELQGLMPSLILALMV